MIALEYLKSKEWSMGNHQCPECWGKSKWWTKFDDVLPNTIGHRLGCKMAMAIKDVSGNPLMEED